MRTGHSIEVFDPEQIAVIEKAYLRALEFVKRSGDADGDADVQENIALHVIVLGRSEETPNILRITNGAIARYRVQRAQELVRKAQIARLQTEKLKRNLAH